MILRFVAPAAAVAVLSIAAPAAAQSNFTHPTDGWSITLPASMATHPLGAVNGDKGQFVVKRGSAEVGICVASSVAPGQDQAVTQQVWTMVVSGYNANPASEAKAAAERAGHTFLKFGGSQPYKSRAGWDGYFFWYDRTNGSTGRNQTTINAATMLGPNHRFVAVCTSSGGAFFEAADIKTIQTFVSSARVP